MAIIYQKKEIEILREGGRRLAKIVKTIAREIKAGRSGLEIEKLCFDLMLKAEARPSFLNHDGFPASLCISINDEVVHSVPSARRFKEGDVVGLDAGLNYQGFHTDMAETVIVGKVENKIRDFVQTANDALKAGIRVARPGGTIGDIGQAIQGLVEKRGFSVVKELSGHGIGRELHEEPSIPNFGISGRGEELKPGMVIAIEPIINMGRREIETSIDGWKVKTKDKSLSAHFEHTVLITSNEPEILTR